MRPPVVIGQRINPSGRPAFIAELRAGDYRTVLREARAQAAAGAGMLDLNVGEGPRDEARAMAEAVRAVQDCVDLPLCIDSRHPEVLKAGLDACSGSPILNSVDGTRRSLRSLLPLAARRGTGVIALTFDERGIPPDAEGRLEIAERILEEAVAAGIPRGDVLVDCLAQPGSGKVALEALGRVRLELGARTVLGISNVSYGMRRGRGKADAAFLSEALERGLDACIADPLSGPVQAALATWRAARRPGGAVRRPSGRPSRSRSRPR